MDDPDLIVAIECVIDDLALIICQMQKVKHDRDKVGRLVGAQAILKEFGWPTSTVSPHSEGGLSSWSKPFCNNPVDPLQVERTKNGDLEASLLGHFRASGTTPKQAVLHLQAMLSSDYPTIHLEYQKRFEKFLSGS